MAKNLLRKLIFRLDGAADSARRSFTSASGHEWEAEFSLHSGTGPQDPRLMVLFRNRSEPRAPQRYSLARPGLSKVPAEAVKQIDEDGLRDLLARSVKL